MRKTKKVNYPRFKVKRFYLNDFPRTFRLRPRFGHQLLELPPLQDAAPQCLDLHHQVLVLESGDSYTTTETFVPPELTLQKLPFFNWMSQKIPTIVPQLPNDALLEPATVFY